MCTSSMVMILPFRHQPLLWKLLPRIIFDKLIPKGSDKLIPKGKLLPRIVSEKLIPNGKLHPRIGFERLIPKGKLLLEVGSEKWIPRGSRSCRDWLRQSNGWTSWRLSCL